MMKRIGLISDTHGFLDEKVFFHLNNCDEIWHAGDIGDIGIIESLSQFKPIKAVYGNIDGPDISRQLPEDLSFNCDGVKVLITHIGGYPPRYNQRVKPMLAEDAPDLFICGHSHILRIMTDPKLNDMLYMNPGAAGKHGLHKVRTLIRFEINDGTISNVQVIELGSRG